ncbi:hypothetical protein [Mycolicibacter algericus]|uniref:hypothetical protein n=1 Tax=Mycolicibacter algericus TaxID=1288388 RepID=UPI0010547C6A|nr:hypothetical protein [Mycolicibacter algericus]
MERLNRIVLKIVLPLREPSRTERSARFQHDLETPNRAVLYADQAAKRTISTIIFKLTSMRDSKYGATCGFATPARFLELIERKDRANRAAGHPSKQRGGRHA